MEIVKASGVANLVNAKLAVPVGKEVHDKNKPLKFVCIITPETRKSIDDLSIGLRTGKIDLCSELLATAIAEAVAMVGGKEGLAKLVKEHTPAAAAPAVPKGAAAPGTPAVPAVPTATPR